MTLCKIANKHFLDYPLAFQKTIVALNKKIPKEHEVAAHRELRRLTSQLATQLIQYDHPLDTLAQTVTELATTIPAGDKQTAQKELQAIVSTHLHPHPHLVIKPLEALHAALPNDPRESIRGLLKITQLTMQTLPEHAEKLPALKATEKAICSTRDSFLNDCRRQTQDIARGTMPVHPDLSGGSNSGMSR